MMKLETKTSRTSIILLVMAIAVTVGGERHLASERGMLDMVRNAYAAGSQNSKPLIDAQVPNEQATATFAMG
jgi:hypothetical protein